MSRNINNSDQELEEYQEKTKRLQKEIVWEQQNLAEAQDRLSQQLQHNGPQELISHWLTPITNALKRIKEVPEDLRGLVDAFVSYAESNEARYGGIPSQIRTRNKKHIRHLQRHGGNYAQSYEQPSQQEVKYRDYAQENQGACPKHSKPGRPPTHTWEHARLQTPN